VYSVGRLCFVGAGDGAGAAVIGEGDGRRVEEPFLLNPVFPGAAKDGKVVDVAANESVTLVIVEETGGAGHGENGVEVSVEPLVSSCTAMCTVPTDYRCEDGRFLVSATCLTISNPNSLSSNEIGVDPKICS
jgi:hypothetical protein